jgi:DNA transformation protein and related proteins
MAVSSEYREWVLEQLHAAGPVTGRAMFGGYGLYIDGLFFGLIDDDVLYFKVDDSTRGEYEVAGSGPFRPMGNEKPMQYYELPANVLEDRSRLIEWTQKALEVARRAKRRR